MVVTQTRLNVVPIDDGGNGNGHVSVIRPPSLPALRGTDPEDLLCGLCASVMTQGVSRDSLLRQFVVAGDLVLACPACGSHNLING